LDFDDIASAKLKADLTNRDRAILWTLTRKVRILTLSQVARTWWRTETIRARAASRRLTLLVKEELLQEDEPLAHPELLLAEPIFRWDPLRGDDEPNFGAVSYRLRSRWKHRVLPTKVFLATKKAVKLFGGDIWDRASRRSEATHDIHLATVYLHHLGSAPEVAEAWVSEHTVLAEGGGQGEKLPDALIRFQSDSQQESFILEFGGAYRKSKLEEFHAAFAHRRYELW
jgi:hypothetical protein